MEMFSFLQYQKHCRDTWAAFDTGAFTNSRDISRRGKGRERQLYSIRVPRTGTKFHPSIQGFKKKERCFPPPPPISSHRVNRSGKVKHLIYLHLSWEKR
ncbi:hypothetical protein FKM82_019711 [Ascaphus truei]